MYDFLTRRWKTQDGTVALEYVLVAAIVGLCLMVGFAGLRNALDSQHLELGGASTVSGNEYLVSGVLANNSGATSTGSQTAIRDRDVNDERFGNSSLIAIGQNGAMVANGDVMP